MFEDRDSSDRREPCYSCVSYLSHQAFAETEP